MDEPIRVGEPEPLPDPTVVATTDSIEGGPICHHTEIAVSGR